MSKRKHKVKIINLKKFMLSSSITLLILILCGALLYNIINHKKIYLKNKPTCANTKNTNNKKDNIKNGNIKEKNIKNIKTSDKEVLITSIGNCTIGTDPKFGYNNSLPYVLEKNNNDYSYFFKNVKSILEKDDFTLANLGTTFTTSNKRSSKSYNFKANPDLAKSLTLGSIEAVNISNNHTHDYLDLGFEDTKKALENENIRYFGEKTKLIENIKGENFGFLGYNNPSNNKDFLDKLKKDISELKSKNCTVIVNFYWYIKGGSNISDSQKNIAHFAIDNGADLIIGDYSHAISSVEKYKNKIICYSLGNFCFGGNFNPKDKDTFILQTKFKFENHKLIGYDTKFIPCSISSQNNINDYCPTPAEASEKERILNKLRNLSPTYGDNIKEEFLPVTNK